jgi:PAS domain S-box-containing protein
MEKALAGQPASFEMWLPYTPGGSTYIAAQYIPDKDEQGEVQGFFALITDLTQKRRNEEKIEKLNRENKRRLDEMEALLEAAPIGIFVGKDKTCTDMVMNRTGARMLRISSEVNPSKSGPDAGQLDFRVFHQGRELSPEELPMQQAAAQAKPIEAFEEVIEFADGTRISLLTYAAPLFDEQGEVRGCIGTFADVSKMRQIERQYRETSLRLQLHIENSPLAAIEWDRHKIIQQWSGSAEKIFGWRAEEAIGRSIEQLGLVYEEDIQSVNEAITELVDGRLETNRRLNRNYRRNGSVIWCDWFNSILRDEQGRMLSALSIALDVTDRKRLEESLREHTQRLEAADRRKDEFLAMLGHELRNPLAPIRNAVQLMKLETDREIDLHWVREIIERQTRRLERMVDDLLDVARIRKGQLKIALQPQPLRYLVLESIVTLKPSIDEKRQRLITELTDEPLNVMGDGTRLIQVFSNLLNNAMRYTPEEGEIRVSLQRQPDRTACIRVADTGKGISADLLPKVFEIFNQEEAIPERSNAGLGLGLILVKQIVQLHKGEVKAESAGLGKGSCFSVILPLIDEPVPAQDDISDARSDTGRHAALEILLVDDNRDVLESQKRLLEAMGHRVRALDAGSKVLDAVRSRPPDLLLLDIGMPDMDGYQVARELARLEQRDRFKVIALTGYAAGAGKDNEKLADFDGYLLKPISLPMLQSYLQKR